MYVRLLVIFTVQVGPTKDWVVYHQFTVEIQQFKPLVDCLV